MLLEVWNHYGMKLLLSTSVSLNKNIIATTILDHSKLAQRLYEENLPVRLLAFGKNIMIRDEVSRKWVDS